MEQDVRLVPRAPFPMRPRSSLTALATTAVLGFTKRRLGRPLVNPVLWVRSKTCLAKAYAPTVRKARINRRADKPSVCLATSGRQMVWWRKRPVPIAQRVSLPTRPGRQPVSGAPLANTKTKLHKLLVNPVRKEVWRPQTVQPAKNVLLAFRPMERRERVALHARALRSAMQVDKQLA